ncbi:MAG: RraA family protein [Halobacteriales archaeon]
MIVRDVDRPRESAIEALEAVNPNDIGHHFHFGFAGPDIEFMETTATVNMVGPVVTARIPPEDSTMVHKLTEIAQPGDVIVVDMGGHTTNAPWGELTTRAAQASGVVGAVIDGSITDSAAIERLEFPVYARGRSPRTTRLHGRGGDINVDVQVGNTVVTPGDVAVGNRDGVLFIPQSRIETAIELTEGVEEHEQRIFEALEAGESLADLTDANDLIEEMGE